MNKLKLPNEAVGIALKLLGDTVYLGTGCSKPFQSDGKSNEAQLFRDAVKQEVIQIADKLGVDVEVSCSETEETISCYPYKRAPSYVVTVRAK